MTIIGFTLSSIESKIDESKLDKSEIQINTTPTIESVEKKELNLANFKEALAIKFTFETLYGEGVGKIKMKGELLYHTDDIDGVLKDWEHKKLKDDVGLEVLNTIMRRCIVHSIYISDLLRLPPPISFPIVKKGVKPNDEEKDDDDRRSSKSSKKK
jgi:hypothetical protein